MLEGVSKDGLVQPFLGKAVLKIICCLVQFHFENFLWLGLNPEKVVSVKGSTRKKFLTQMKSLLVQLACTLASYFHGAPCQESLRHCSLSGTWGTVMWLVWSHVQGEERWLLQSFLIRQSHQPFHNLHSLLLDVLQPDHSHNPPLDSSRLFCLIARMFACLGYKKSR